MKKFILPIITVIICIILLITLAFTHKKENKSLTKIKVAEVTHSLFYTPLYVAHSLGYFENEDLDVEIILTSGANNVAAAVMSGDVQIGFCGSEQTLYIYNEGAKDYLVNFAGLTKRDGSFIVSREKIKNFSLDDLKGKTILGGRQGGMPAMTLAYTLYENNIDDANVDTSIDFAAMSGAFISGNGDFVTLFEPNALALEQQGYGYVVESVGSIGGEVPYTAFNAKKSYIKNNPDIIKKFNTALQKGIDYTFSHSSDELALILTDYFPDNSLNEISTVIERYKKIDSWYNTTYITSKGFNHMQDIVEYNGALTKRVSYNILVDNTYNEKDSRN